MIVVRKRSRPIPVKLDDLTISRLDRASRSIGTNNRSSVIKIAIAMVLRDIEAGTLHLPATPATAEATR